MHAVSRLRVLDIRLRVELQGDALGIGGRIDRDEVEIRVRERRRVHAAGAREHRAARDVRCASAELDDDATAQEALMAGTEALERGNPGTRWTRQIVRPEPAIDAWRRQIGDEQGRARCALLRSGCAEPHGNGEDKSDADERPRRA